jgi:hypothetical protein
VGVTLVLDQGELADPRVGLAQLDAELFGQPHQPRARPVDQPGIGREHDRLRLDRRVDHHAREVLGSQRLGPRGGRQALLDQRQELLLAHALAPARQRRAVEHQPVLEELLAAEELEIGVLHPALAQRLIGEVVGVLEDRQSRHQPRRQRRMAGLVAVGGAELLFQEAPVDRLGELHQRMIEIDDLV